MTRHSPQYPRLFHCALEVYELLAYQLRYLIEGDEPIRRLPVSQFQFRRLQLLLHLGLLLLEEHSPAFRRRQLEAAQPQLQFGDIALRYRRRLARDPFIRLTGDTERPGRQIHRDSHDVRHLHLDIGQLTQFLNRILRVLGFQQFLQAMLLHEFAPHRLAADDLGAELGGRGDPEHRQDEFRADTTRAQA